ncbi:hypothetical protein [Mycolicibacterium sp. CR10]|uniref:hypothetical protein n=1 Tax=Mycolicibacterium sp. CR10 TaxID=2562314 RepID=UPI0010C066A8|nr:hypothetical protein [Mycolicibacterium sp. CR10]
MPNTTPPKVRALCCDCGHLRTVSRRYSAPNDDNRTRDDNQHPRGWRCTMTLKCSNCRRPSRHAILRDDDRPDFRDIAETRQNLRPGEGLPHGTFGGDGPRRHLASISEPAETEYVDEWCDVVGDANRYFRGAVRVVHRDSDNDIKVLVDGLQRPNGQLVQQIMIAEGDTEAIAALTSEQARQLGAALIEAAHEADRR